MGQMPKTPKRTRPSGSYTAADVRKTAGLSYRQLAAWEEQGVIGNPRNKAETWRKYTPKQVFALMVSEEIRRKFNVPLESVRWVQSFMEQEEANHFRVAVEIMSRGMSVLLLTDLTDTFVMDSDLEIEDLLHLGYFRSEHPQAYMLIKLNPLVNKLLQCLKEPFQLQIHGKTYALIRSIRGEFALRFPQELEVLRLIRDGQYRSVTVHLKDGKIHQADAETERPAADRDKLLEILDSDKFQTVTATKHDGTVFRVNKKKTIKFGSVPVRQEDPEHGPRKH